MSGAGAGVLLAAALMLAAGGLPASAEPAPRDPQPVATVVAAPDGATATLHGVSRPVRDALSAGTARALLRPAGAAGGMVATVSGQDGGGAALVLTPRFPLLPGAAYEAVIRMGDGREIVIAVTGPKSGAGTARVSGVWPATPVLPENALRLYVSFDQPMARGSARRNIRLEDAQGVRLDDSFLNLATELWSADQTRLTLLLDPGRIKRGVGPNAEIGAPLESGRSYRLVIDASMLDAAAQPLGQPHVHAFRTGPAERRRIDPGAWRIDLPSPGRRDALRVGFGRVIDRANAARTLVPVNDDGRPLRGQITMTDRSWHFVPDLPWPSGDLTLRIDPRLEDVAGNTICYPFDVTAGGARACGTPIYLVLE